MYWGFSSTKSWWFLEQERQITVENIENSSLRDGWGDSTGHGNDVFQSMQPPELIKDRSLIVATK